MNINKLSVSYLSSFEEMEEIKLHIDGQIFKVRKSLLCEFSDYFRAMFSGKYVEEEKQEITIDVVDAESMKLIKQYMEIGLIDLMDFNLATIAELAMAANFLQITELIKQIEYTLDLQLSISNWVEILTIAENATYSKLQQLAASFGLLCFKLVEVSHIPTLERLVWYLGHSHLDAETEYQVFEFGYNWITRNECGSDALLIILGCLDISRLTMEDTTKMKILVTEHLDSLAEKTVNCLYELFKKQIELSIDSITNHKTDLCKTITESVYSEVFNLIKDSKKRKLKFTPIVPMYVMKDSKTETVPHYMYTFNKETGFQKWLEVADKNLWGWNIASWGATKLVVVCGEFGRGSGMFMRDVRVYDTLRKEWIQHGVKLPCRRHGGVTVVGDSLYIVGGVGGFSSSGMCVRYFPDRYNPMRVVLDTAIIYDFKQRSFRSIARLPDAIQNPAVCSHEGHVYAAGEKNIYRYEEIDGMDRWVSIVGTAFRNSTMISFKGYIYCTQNIFTNRYRFRPGVDDRIEVLSSFSAIPASICNLGQNLVAFAGAACGLDYLAVEEFDEKEKSEKPNIIWSQSNANIKVNDVAGSCSLVLYMPPTKPDLSPYAIKYLNRHVVAI